MFYFDEKKDRLEMVEGDFGIKLPIEIEGVTIEEKDSISLKIFKEMNATPIIPKTFTNISINKIRQTNN